MRTATVTSVTILALLTGFAACAAPQEREEDVGTEASALARTGVFKGLAGKCLDAGAQLVIGSKARLFDCNGSAAQKWTVSGTQLLAGGKCLDLLDGSSASGTAAVLADCVTDRASQSWTVDGNRIRGLGSKCLDVYRADSTSGTAVILWDCHGGPNQQWLFQESTTTTSTGTGGSTPTTRDVRKWPFAQNSIWNMPIGSGAVFAAANLADSPGNNIWALMPGVDEEHIVLRPSAPMTNINYSDAAWTGKNRCAATGGLLVQVPMPTDDVVPNSTHNVGATFLLPDGKSLIQVQPLARCTAGGPGTALVKWSPVDIYGDGRPGAHGGSGLSSFGGSIRVGELRPGGAPMRHALKINVYAKQELYRCTSRATCYRWPAFNADSYAVGWYGTAGSAPVAMKMGSLLAIPGTTSIDALGLETAPAKMLAWTFQNYGAYIVDDMYAPGFGISAEDGPDGSVPEQFQRDWGFPLQQKMNDNTPWRRDIQRLRNALRVVDNNSPTSIGGGGTPRQPLAPAL